MSALLLSSLLLSLSPDAAARTPDAAVSTLWQALSNDPGAPANLSALKRLFHEDAVVFGARYKESEPVLRRYRRAEFLKFYEAANPDGFYECEVARQIKVYDRFAVAYSVVESRSDRSEAKADFVGVNSIQLYQVGDDWQVVSLYYHVGKEGLPISLDGGQSGQCLN